MPEALLLELGLNTGILLTFLAFPLPQLRPVAAIIFFCHWGTFILGRVVPGKHFRSETRTTTAALFSYTFAALFTLTALGHTTLNVSDPHQRATFIFLLWVVYSSWSERPGRVFPTFRRGDPVFRRLLTWSGQAVRVFVQGLPLWIQLSCPVPVATATPVPFASNAWALVGCLVWGAGVFIVHSSHRSRPFATSLSAVANGRSVNARPEQLLTTMRAGLWRFSRHPDLFGECVVWLGIVVLFCSTSSTTGMATNGPDTTTCWYALVSPLFGVVAHCMFTIPSLEKDQLLRFNHLPSYRSYIETTSSFFPLPLSSNNEALFAFNSAADAQEYSQPTNRGAYKSSRADTITEALQASKAAKLKERDAQRKARQEAQRNKQKKKKKRVKTPQVRHRGKRISVQ